MQGCRKPWMSSLMQSQSRSFKLFRVCLLCSRYHSWSSLLCSWHLYNIQNGRVHWNCNLCHVCSHAFGLSETNTKEENAVNRDANDWGDWRLDRLYRLNFSSCVRPSGARFRGVNNLCSSGIATCDSYSTFSRCHLLLQGAALSRWIEKLSRSFLRMCLYNFDCRVWFLLSLRCSFIRSYNSWYVAPT